MRRIAGVLALSFGLLMPIGVSSAQEHPPAQHQWNDNENTAWRQYLKEHHKKYHDWAKSNKKEQDAYWKWRDAHPDAR